MLAGKYGVSFEFNDNAIRNKTVDPATLRSPGSLEGVLDRILIPLSMRHEQFGKGSYLIFIPPAAKPSSGKTPFHPEGGMLPRQLSAPVSSGINAPVTLKWHAPGSIRDIEVQGVVSGEDGEALPGVSILVRGTSKGTSTDENGGYRIAVPDQNIRLVFFFCRLSLTGSDFLAVSGGYILSQEEFLRGAKVSFLKIRAGYGEVGNTAISPFQTLGGLSRSIYIFGTTAAFGFENNLIPNPDLKWGISKTTNLGLDFGFFDDRISGSVEYYITNTRDLLLNRLLPTTSGYNSILQNIGSTRNSGWELSV